MSADQLFILKKEIVGAKLPYLIKLNRETGHLEVFHSCNDDRLYTHLSIKKAFDASAYAVFEKVQSFPCIFGGNKSPTPTGLFHIETKSAKEYNSSYYPNHSQVKFFGYLAIFEDYFIHSDLYATDEVGPSVDKAISRSDKTTSGCIRVPQENLAWLIENIEIGTLIFL